MPLLSSDIIEAMEKHAREEYPRECCGMLAGTENVITKILKTRTIAANMGEFELDPLEQVHAFEAIDRLCLKL
jgi:proteasome lid subunit RPN8/RPN11